MRTILAIIMAVALLTLGGVTGAGMQAHQGHIVADDGGGNGAGG
jgi:hypothetical protein